MVKSIHIRIRIRICDGGHLKYFPHFDNNVHISTELISLGSSNSIIAILRWCASVRSSTNEMYFVLLILSISEYWSWFQFINLMSSPNFVATLFWLYQQLYLWFHLFLLHLVEISLRITRSITKIVVSSIFFLALCMEHLHLTWFQIKFKLECSHFMKNISKCLTIVLFFIKCLKKNIPLNLVDGFQKWRMKQGIINSTWWWGLGGFQ